MKILAILGFILTAIAAQAQKTVIMPVNIKATVYVQNASTVYGDTTTVLTPQKYSLTTKSLLAMLAIEENRAGHYAFTNFIAGSTLAFICDTENFQNSYFGVVFAGSVICNVSDIFTFTQDPSTSNVEFGKYKTATGFASNYKQNFVATVTYDNTGNGGNTKFYLAGLLMGNSNDAAQTGGVFYKETLSAKFSNGFGAGELGGQNCYLIGGFSAAGSALFSY